jgi:hypothetical protein
VQGAQLVVAVAELGPCGERGAGAVGLDRVGEGRHRLAVGWGGGGRGWNGGGGGPGGGGAEGGEIAAGVVAEAEAVLEALPGVGASEVGALEGEAVEGEADAADAAGRGDVGTDLDAGGFEALDEDG